MSGAKHRVPLAIGALITVGALAGCAGDTTPGVQAGGEILYAWRNLPEKTDTFFAFGPDGAVTTRLELPGTLADARPSMDRRQVAYIVNLATEPRGQVLQISGLAPDEQPLDVTATTTGEAALHGLVWSADGKRLAYGKELGQLNLSDPAAIKLPDAWEIHTVDLEGLRAGRPDADRVVWRIADDEMVPAVYRLEAWDPASNRAVVSLRHGQLFYAHALRLVDTAAGTAVGADLPTRFSPLPYVDLQSPDRAWMLVPEAALTGRDELEELFPDLPNAISRLRLADGSKEPWYGLGTSEPTWTLWSPDGRHAAWMEVEQLEPPDAPLATPGNPTATPIGYPTPTFDPKNLERPELRARLVDAQTARSVWDAEGTTVGERIMAFSPDGQAFALAHAGATHTDPSRLETRSVSAPNGRPDAVNRALPERTVLVLWLDRPGTGDGN